jgi:hypothetical protein
MALVNLKDVTVTRVNSNGYGFGVKEENESGGKTYTTYWTIWAKEPHGLTVGDVISVSGFLTAKVSEPKAGDPTKRVFADLSINSPRIQGQQATTAPPAASQAPAEEWSQPNTFDGQVPF